MTSLLLFNTLFDALFKKAGQIKFLFFMAGLFVATTGSAIAQSSTAEAELLAVQQERFEAAIFKDISKLEQMVAEEVRYCHTTGAVDTKASYLETVRTGGIGWLEVNPIGMEARIYGDVGIIAGEVKQKITVGGRAGPIDMHIRTIDVYVKRGGRWQLTEFQASNVR
jgi:hypothetical protein